LQIHERRISCPAPYMGEKVLNPMVSGGGFDTTGHKALPALPEFKDSGEVFRDDPRSEASPGNRGKVAREALTEHFQSSDFKEAKRARAAVKAENKQKQKRAAAIRRGENVNMRRDRCAGDPAITA
jgi:hypothetical protein